MLLDMLFAIEPKARVFAIDTHYLFPETYELWREVERRYDTKVEVFEGPSPEELAATHGDELWERKPDLYLAIAKVEPLVRALGGLDAWITGIRRDQSPTRANAPKLGWDEAHELWKANPLADWSDDDCWAYIRERGLPYNPLHDRGYESIGDTHSTIPGAGREGRWAGTDRTECGLHVARRSREHRRRPRRTLSHLDELEAEAIHIMREVAAERERPVLLFSGGKDSIVMLRLAEKAFRPAKFPFPVMHVDTGHNFPEVIEYRDRRVAELGERLVVASVQESIDQGRVQSSRRARARRATSCRRRRCSTRSRSTASTPRWAARAATRSAPARRSASSASATTSASGTRARSGPSSGTSTTRASARASTSASSRSRTGRSSTCGSTSRARTSSCRRSTSRTSARCSAATGCSTPSRSSSSAFPTRSRSRASVRFRTVGDMTCTGGVVSDAATIDEVVTEIAATRVTERGETRADDRVSRGRDGGPEARWLLLRSSSTPSCCGSSPRARSTTASRR